jgi:hypothetical protein
MRLGGRLQDMAWGLIREPVMETSLRYWGIESIEYPNLQ